MTIKIARVQTSDRLINQLQQNIASAVEPLFNDLSGQFVATLTGCSDTPVGIVFWQRATQAGPVTIVLPGLRGTSNSTAATITGLPAGLWPASSQVLFVRATDNGNTAAGLVDIEPTGVMNLTANAAGSAFTASGNKGVATCVITYATSV